MILTAIIFEKCIRTLMKICAGLIKGVIIGELHGADIPGTDLAKICNRVIREAYMLAYGL